MFPSYKISRGVGSRNWTFGVSNSGCIVPIKNPTWDHPKISITTPLELPKFSFLGNIQTGHQAGNVPFPSWKQKTPETLKSKGYNWAINCWDSMLLPSQKGCVCFVFFFQGPLNFTNARSWRLHWKATRRGQLRTHTLRVSVKTKCHYCHYKKGYGWWLTVKIQGCSW